MFIKHVGLCVETVHNSYTLIDLTCLLLRAYPQPVHLQPTMLINTVYIMCLLQVTVSRCLPIECNLLC
jgi:hypothetical protein